MSSLRGEPRPAEHRPRTDASAPPLCARCDYPLAGLPETEHGGALVRCPECGTEQPRQGPGQPGIRNPWVRRLLTGGRWAGEVGLAAAFVLLFVVTVTLLARGVGGVAGDPFTRHLANSELVQHDAGRAWAAIDMVRCTPEVSARMFRDSGGWGRALRSATWAAALAAGAAAALGGAGLGASTTFLPRWAAAVLAAGASAFSAWVARLICLGSAGSPSTGNYAHSLAGLKVGMPVGIGAGVLCGLAAVSGVVLVRRARGRAAAAATLAARVVAALFAGAVAAFILFSG